MTTLSRSSLFFAAWALLAPADPACATAITFSDGLSLSGSYNGGPVAGSTQYSLNQFSAGSGNSTLNLGGGASLSLGGTPSAQIENGSQSGLYAAPYENGQQITSNYVAVFTGSDAILTLGAEATGLGLLWGSVDPGSTRNLITFENVTSQGTAIIGSVDGDQLASYFSQNPPPLQASSWYQYGSAYADVTSAIPFNTVLFQDVSGSNSFEFGQLSVFTVPAPSSLSVLLSGLLALGLLTARRRATDRRQRRSR